MAFLCGLFGPFKLGLIVEGRAFWKFCSEATHDRTALKWMMVSIVYAVEVTD